VSLDAPQPGGSGRHQDDAVRFGGRRPPRRGAGPGGHRAIRRTPPNRRWPAWPVLLAMVALAATLIATASHGRRPPAPSAHGQRPSRAPAAVTVTQAGHPLLGATGGWELFGLIAGEVVDIQPGRGRVTRTVIPPLMSTGPVSFVAGPGQVIIRPLDLVPGYLVADGQPARVLPGALSHGGPVFPGPARGQLWVQTASGNNTAISLATMDGHTLGVTIRFPGGDASLLRARSDGSGYFLLPWAGGVYDARPGRLRLITTGTVVAVGPTRWLAVECGRPPRCAEVVIDQASGARRVLPRHSLSGPSAGAEMFPGAISPDGSTAAVFRAGKAGTPVLHLIDLASGADHLLPVQGSTGTGTMAWSPDSRWLFVASAQGQKLLAINAHTLRASGLGIALPPVTQVAVENT
jgi:hypothetical protein